MDSASSNTIAESDRQALVRDKYAGDRTLDISEDLERLAQGEPLAYVIGWIPFLGLRIELASRPLIPRPETEWWCMELLEHLEARFGAEPFRMLDLCAGSGAIGLAVLARFPAARVSFGELRQEHARQVIETLVANGLDATRAHVKAGDLFAPFPGEAFDIIASNPPYIPAGRQLPREVREYEPAEALFSGTDGLSLIRRIAADMSAHTVPRSELWLECDTSTVVEAADILKAGGAGAVEIRTDQYGRERYLVAYFSS